MTAILDNWINRHDRLEAFNTLEWNWEALQPIDCFTSIHTTIPFEGGVIHIFTGNSIPSSVPSVADFCEGSFPVGNEAINDDALLLNADFHVEIFDNEGEPIQCPITNGIFPEEGETHGANLTPEEVGQIILQFQND